MTSYVQRWYSVAHEAHGKALDEFSTEEFCEKKISEMLEHWKVLAWGGQIPRRLGRGASGVDLAKDKKFFRKAVNVCQLTVRHWAPLCPTFTLPVGDPTEFTDGHKRLGAQLQPELWVTERIGRAEVQRAMGVTVALQLGLSHWAARVANACNQEISGWVRVRDWLRDGVTGVAVGDGEHQDSG